MAKTVAVSFEESDIKIVHASLSGNSCTVERAEILEYDELDSYLQREKAAEFIVIYDFKEAYHGFLSIPILKPRYQLKVMESELRKILKLSDISFIHVPVEERRVENRNVLEIFYFAINNEVIRDIVETFYENDKVVKAIYPTVFSAASLIHSESATEANMGIFATGKEKIVFFKKHKGVSFIRNYESLDAELSDFDIQNINMTISYCWQNIKLNPSSVVLLGSLGRSSRITMMPTAPIACLHQRQDIKCSSEQFSKHFLPIASFYTSGNSNVLSHEFRSINMIKSYMGFAARAFLILALCSLLVLFYKSNEAMSLKDQIEKTMAKGSDVESIYSAYNERNEYMMNLRPIIEFLNRPSPELQNLLINMAAITADEVRFNSIQAGSKDGRIYSVTLNGVSRAETFSALQASFSSFIRDLSQMKEIEINNQSLNLEHKTFKVELTYRATG